MTSITHTIHELEQRQAKIDAAIRTLRSLSNMKGGRRSNTGTHRMSAEGRKRIAEAQKKRWAKIHAEAKKK